MSMMDVCTFNQSGNQMWAVSLSLPCDEMCEERQVSRRRGKDIRKPTLTIDLSCASTQTA